MIKKKEEVKIYIRNFIFEDGHVEKVETKDGEEMMSGKYRAAYAKSKHEGKIKETKDEVRFEYV